MNTPRRRKLVLVADDYTEAAESLAALLSMASPSPIDVSFALDGALAVQSALATHPDMAILDIEMPNLDGVGAAMAMRSALGAGAPLLVALTGNHARAADERTLSAFDHALSKPANLDALLALLAGVG